MIDTTATKDKKSEMILTVEKNLQRSLRPVNPNPLFVQRLENRLNNYPAISMERHAQVHPYLIVLVVFLSSLSICWLFWRFLFKKD